MREQLKTNHDELREKMRKYDEAILQLVKEGSADLIIQIIKDYLLQHE